MAKGIGSAKIKQYSLQFKRKAVQLSDRPGVLIKDAAELCMVPTGA
jgi:transposase